jgi:4-hydroxybenzoate polyprenyltransferase
MGKESMTILRNARELYEVDVRSGAYGERRWAIMAIAAIVLILLASIGLLMRNQISGYWFILAVFVASAVLLTIPILVKRIRREQ